MVRIERTWQRASEGDWGRPPLQAVRHASRRIGKKVSYPFCMGVPSSWGFYLRGGDKLRPQRLHHSDKVTGANAKN
ncbi:hypothetical protein [Paraburkholderia ginsengiterrae]|uniref:hypothetical protein n=1 Tax=Paraburkholderia ginsengiterrae TaxID=1462993 RepID=UPI000A5DD436|nr:hypothetical protein [Paraburkholderia ginsengiterrae]